MKKVFSQKDGTLQIVEGNLILLENNYKPIASIEELANFSVYILPSTLIRYPKSDEELAEELYQKKSPRMTGGKYYYTYEEERMAFIAGRKSVVGEYTRNDMIAYAKWLQENDTIDNACTYFHFTDDDMLDTWLNEVRNKSIYPTSIEVEYDGTTYLWETLKATYEK